MRSVTALSADVRRATRVATALSGASALLLALTAIGGLYAIETIALFLDMQGWSLLAGSAAAATIAAIVLRAARDRILLRTGLWFGHVFAHHHLTCSTLADAPTVALAADERAFRVIHAALVNGTIARRMDTLWLPVMWAALAIIHPALAAAAALFAGILIAAGSLAASKSDADVAPVVLGELVRAVYPTAASIDAWEIQNRAAVAALYATQKRTASRRIILGALTAMAALALALVTAWLAQDGNITLAAAMTAAALQIRHAAVALAYASDATARAGVKRAALGLAETRIAAREAPRRAGPRHAMPRTYGLDPTHDVLHAA
jgi:hypothetical protein